MSDHAMPTSGTPDLPPAAERAKRWAEEGRIDPATFGAYLKAVTFALTLHTEVRKGGRGVPYLTHLLDVSSTVWEDGGTLEAAIAGLLHDVVEDQNVTYDQLDALFGDRVAAIVGGCTDSGELKPDDPKPAFLERKKAHLFHLRQRADRIRAGQPLPEDVEVLMVTTADKLSNLRSTLGDIDVEGEDYLATFKGGLFVTHWYYATVIAILVDGFTGPDGTVTSRAVRDLQRELVRLDELCDRERVVIGDRAARLAAVLADLPAPGPAGDPRFGRGAVEVMSADLERELVALEALRRVRVEDAKKDGNARDAITLLFVKFYEDDQATTATHGAPYAPFVDAVLMAASA